jgi:hypothetical protein
MLGIYTYIPEKNHVPKEYNVAAILSLLFVVPISLNPVVIIIIIIIKPLIELFSEAVLKKVVLLLVFTHFGAL